jgi:uncharacterized membrane protein
MFKILLVIHVLSVIVWFGGSIYERLYIIPSLKKSKGTKLEVEFAKMILATEHMFKLSTIGVLLTGILMTVVAGYGFFDWSWLGVKQMLAVVMLVFFGGYVVPRMTKFKSRIKPALEEGLLLTESIRTNLFKFYHGLDIIHIGVFVNTVLALWKPFF